MNIPLTSKSLWEILNHISHKPCTSKQKQSKDRENIKKAIKIGINNHIKY